MTIRRTFCGLLALVSLAVAAPALAHKESDAYLSLHTDPANEHVLRGRWDIALRDLDFAIGIDSNRDGAITWGEVKAHRTAIERHALARLSIRGDGLHCTTAANDQKITRHTDGAYAVMEFTATCNKNIPTTLSIGYRLFRDVDPYHRGIVTLRAGDKTAGAVLGPNKPVASLNLRQPSRWRQFKSFVGDGIWHIWTGFDHMLFLLALLFPAVLVRRRQNDDRGSGRPALAALADSSSLLALSSAGPKYRWQAASGFWQVLLEVVKVVSAFTVSHSVTLSLAVLGIVALPSRLVESGIALSVIVAAFNNIYPIVRQRTWLIAFSFGFIHGLGFASALSGLNLPAGAMTASLGGFNVGVEIGQEAIVLAFLPFAWLLRNTRFYRIGLVRWGSWLIVAVAAGWLVQRAFAVQIPLFHLLLPA